MAKVNKPASRPAATPKTAPSAAPDDLDEDEDVEDEIDDEDGGDGDDEDGGDKASGRNWMKTQRLAPSKREAVLLGNLVNKLSRRADVIKAWTPADAVKAREQLAASIDSLKAAAESLAKVDITFRPVVRGPKGGPELAPGMLVKITDKRKAEYAGVIADEHMVGIKVKELRGNRVVVTMGDGIQAMFPRGHVTVDA